MATKPSSLPVWATTGGTTTTPSGGQQAAGFAINTKPPAKWVNWLFNLIYQWIQYIDNPVGVGAGAGFSATGGATGNGLEGTGGGTSGNGVKGNSATASSAVNGVNTGTGRGVSGTGGTGAAGVRGNGGASGGTGVEAVSTSGYGLTISGDATSPAKAAMNIATQDTEASSPAQGDVQMVNTKLEVYNGTEFDKPVVQSHSQTATSTSAATTALTAFGEKYTIPANTLKVGSTIRIRALLGCNNDGGGGNVFFELRLGSVTVAQSSEVPVFASQTHLLEAVISIRSLGAAGVIVSSGTSCTSATTTVTLISHDPDISDPKTVDTTGALDVTATYDFTVGGNQVKLVQLIVDVN